MPRSNVTRRESQPELIRIFGKPSGEKLGKLGLANAEDLLHHYPRRYVERGELTPLDQGEEGEYLSYVARLKDKSQRRVKNNTLTLTLLVFTDGRTDVTCAFFSKSHHTVNKGIRRLREGDLALVTGKIRLRRHRRDDPITRELIHPNVTAIEDDEDPDLGPAPLDPDAAKAEAARPIPIYPAAEGVHNDFIVNSVKTVLGPMRPGDLPDPVPEHVRRAHGLLPLLEAIREVHAPPTIQRGEQAKDTLRFHEAFVFQAALARRRQHADSFEATPRGAQSGGLADRLLAQLPFDLTPGQQEVAAEIREDLSRDRPMQRLLQGEVGSGKTVVALQGILQVIDAGGQAALLAPTEVLAAQHARSITALLGPLAPEGGVTLLTGSMPTAQRRQALLDAASGGAGLVIGTHALLSETVQFAELGLVVVDEQHRFGVEQRDVLRTKADTSPHYLVMTATPIPRSVAMTVFGDVDTSTLRELPAGRPAVHTHIVDEANTEWVQRVWQRVAEEAARGGRAYIVCPRIGDDDDGAGGRAQETLLSKEDLRSEDAPQAEGPGAGEETGDRAPISVLELAETLGQDEALAGIEKRILHGRMGPQEKDEAMADFAAGRAPVLISTTVIEVGVDVPEATIMVIMDGHMFGLSQLHQLRGRIGRGTTEGVCLVITPSRGRSAVTRLKAFAATRDGFELAEQDLKLRREGDVLGSAQSGSASSLKLLRVLTDTAVIDAAREAARAVIEADPGLTDHPALASAIARIADHEDYLDRA